MSSFRIIRLCSVLMAFLFAGLSAGGAADSSKADKPPESPDRLVQILLGKGILTLAEVESLGQGSPPSNKPGSSVSFVQRAFSRSPRPRLWELHRQPPKSLRH